MIGEVGQLPPQELERVLKHGLAIAVTPPRTDGGLEYVATLQSALKHKYPKVLVTYVRGNGGDWVIFYRATAPIDLLGEDQREELLAAAREVHGLPIIGASVKQKIPEAKIAAVKASLCSTNGPVQLHHKIEIGTDRVEGTPRHRIVAAIREEPEEISVGLLMNVAVSGNQAKVLFRTGPKDVSIVGSSNEIRELRYLSNELTKLLDRQIEVTVKSRTLTAKASCVKRALSSLLATLQNIAVKNFKLKPPTSSD